MGQLTSSAFTLPPTTWQPGPLSETQPCPPDRGGSAFKRAMLALNIARAAAETPAGATLLVGDEPPQPSLEEMKAWLGKFRLLDPHLSDPLVVRRYNVFSTVDLSSVPEPDWMYYFQELLPFENGLAASQSDIGNVASHPYAVEVLPSLRPKVDKPIRYAPS